MKETDFPTKNCRSAKKITQLKTTIEKQRQRDDGASSGAYTRVTRWGKFGRVFCKQTNVAACRFQNECNKVEIALRVVQFWSDIKLVITNRTPASRSYDFVITRLISYTNCTPLSAITIIYQWFADQLFASAFGIGK